jgi:glycosyltransferase involved in cell wall biosynthesis
MQKVPYILWLASWYPTKLDAHPGDFIQRHAKALALFHPVHVLHIAKDEHGEITSDILIEENIEGNLHETIIYYHPLKTGWSLIDRLISTRKFLEIGKGMIRRAFADHSNMFIHVHVAMRHGLLARWGKRALGIEYVITEHWTGYDRTTHPQQLRPSTWFWIATKEIFKGASYFYPEVKRVGELINQTIASIPYKPVSNSVDTSLFYLQKEKVPTIQTFHFIHVSTLSYQKNIEGILRVIERCAKQKEDMHFTLIGPASDQVIAQVNTSPSLAGAVTLTGALPYHVVAEYMRIAHSLLMFSRYENQPCVILEALCCGLPVISTNVGGIAEVIDKSNGRLIASENEDELYAAIHTLIEHYNQFDLAHIAEKSRDQYSYETIGKQMLAYYQQDMPQFF